MKSSIGIDDRVGFVYIIKAHGFGFYKVGFSSTIRSALGRIRIFQKGSPLALYFVGLIPNRSVHDERHIHRQLRAFAIHGEWFGENKCLGGLIAKFPSTRFLELDCENDCQFLKI